MITITVCVMFGLVCLGIVGSYFLSNIQVKSYKAQLELMETLYSMEKYTYLTSDILVHDSRMAFHRNQLLEMIADRDYIKDDDKNYIRAVIFNDSDTNALNVANSTANIAKDYMIQLRDKVKSLSFNVNFDYPHSQKDLKRDIKSLNDRIEFFIDREFNKDKDDNQESKPETNETENA